VFLSSSFAVFVVCWLFLGSFILFGFFSGSLNPFIFGFPSGNMFFVSSLWEFVSLKFFSYFHISMKSLSFVEKRKVDGIIRFMGN